MVLTGSTTWMAKAQTPSQPRVPLLLLAQTTNTEPDLQDLRSPQGDSRINIRSDRQEMDEEKGILTASGQVQITYPAYNLTATAAQAQYFTRERRLILSGGVEVIQTGGNRIHGERLIYAADSQTLTVEPKPGEQVHSTYNLSPPTQQVLTP